MAATQSLFRATRLHGWGAGISFLFLIAVLLAGCAKSVPPPKYKINPAPKYKYIMTIYSDHEFPKIISIDSDYQIANEGCVPIDYARAIGGVRLSYPAHLHLHAVKINGNGVKVKFSKDSIVPENYWGLGVCKWNFVAVTTVIEMDGLQSSIAFRGSDVRDGAKSIWKCALFGRSPHRHLQCFHVANIGSWDHATIDSTTGKKLVWLTFLMNLRRVRK